MKTLVFVPTSAFILNYTVNSDDLQISVHSSLPQSTTKYDYIFRSVLDLLTEIGLPTYLEWLTEQPDLPDDGQLLDLGTIDAFLEYHPADELFDQYPTLHCLDSFFDQEIWDQCMDQLQIPKENRQDSHLYTVIANLIIDMYQRLIYYELPDQLGTVSHIFCQT